MFGRERINAISSIALVRNPLFSRQTWQKSNQFYRKLRIRDLHRDLVIDASCDENAEAVAKRDVACTSHSTRGANHVGFLNPHHEKSGWQFITEQVRLGGRAQVRPKADDPLIFPSRGQQRPTV